jgi:hypothetical protein
MVYVMSFNRRRADSSLWFATTSYCYSWKMSSASFLPQLGVCLSAFFSLVNPFVSLPGNSPGVDHPSSGNGNQPQSPKSAPHGASKKQIRQKE